MKRRVSARAVTTVALALGLILESTWRDVRLVVPLSAQQQIDWIPGPIIEDPPGPFTGFSYVPPENVVAPGSALSTFVVTYNGFPPDAQAAFQAAVDVWASQI